jgi:hypothetical protein
MDRFREFVSTVAEEGTGWRDDLSCRTRDGDTVPVEVTASMVKIEGEQYLLAILRESER